MSNGNLQKSRSLNRIKVYFFLIFKKFKDARPELVGWHREGPRGRCLIALLGRAFLARSHMAVGTHPSYAPTMQETGGRGATMSTAFL